VKHKVENTIATIKERMSEIDINNASPDDIIDLGKRVNDLYDVGSVIGNKKAVRNIIGNFRDVGGEISQKTWYTRSNSQIKAQLQEAFSYYPKDWANLIADSGKRFFAGKKANRGFFQRELVDASGKYLIRGASAGEGVSIYSTGQRETTAYHEIGHLVEYFKPEIMKITKEWVAKRTAGEQPERMRDIMHDNRYAINEVTKKDNFISPYIGKNYGDRATEVLSMGLESIFVPGRGQLKRVNGLEFEFAKITDDEEYLNLIIGLLLKG
jgi:hypothetical protein